MNCVKVGCLVSGEIDCADLRVKLLANTDKPAILNVNIGNFCLFLYVFYYKQGNIIVL